MAHYSFIGEHAGFEATRQQLEERLKTERGRLQDYENLLCDQEDDNSYVARGNGFCDSKYSTDFVELQIAQIASRISQLERWIEEYK